MNFVNLQRGMCNKKAKKRRYNGCYGLRKGGGYYLGGNHVIRKRKYKTIVLIIWLYILYINIK